MDIHRNSAVLKRNLHDVLDYAATKNHQLYIHPTGLYCSALDYGRLPYSYGDGELLGTDVSGDPACRNYNILFGTLSS